LHAKSDRILHALSAIPSNKHMILFIFIKRLKVSVMLLCLYFILSGLFIVYWSLVYISFFLKNAGACSPFCGVFHCVGQDRVTRFGESRTFDKSKSYVRYVHTVNILRERVLYSRVVVHVTDLSAFPYQLDHTVLLL
jgi:hypothetical protein